MLNHRYRILCLAAAGLFILAFATPLLCQEQAHIRKLDTVRASMAKMGSSLPDAIRKAQPGDIRTLERVFEINNYALVTIESYLKMIKIALSSGSGINKSVLEVLNGWLKFISYYCEYDIKYMDEALTQTKDTAVVEILKSEKSTIADLRDVSQAGINENTTLSAKL